MRVEKSLHGVAVIAVPASRWPVVCALVIALLWSGAISASGPQTWQSLFGLIWPRLAWSWSWRHCSTSTRSSTAAEHAITALRLDQRRHLRLAQPDSCSAPGYLDRRSMLATGRRVQD